MMSRLFHAVPINVFTELSVVIFLGIFLWIVVWTYLPSRRAIIDKSAAIPLED